MKLEVRFSCFSHGFGKKKYLNENENKNKKKQSAKIIRLKLQSKKMEDTPNNRLMTPVMSL